MPTKLQMGLSALESASCPATCLMIIAANSPMYRLDRDLFRETARKPGAKLGDVEITSSKADRRVRVEINTAVGSTHPIGSFSAQTKIADILIWSC